MDTTVGWTRRLGRIPIATARGLVEAALKKEEFGILTEIDVQATLDTKLGKKIAPYLVLGACNPVIAHRALEIDAGIGLVMPCNVTLREESGGEIVVEIGRPSSMFRLLNNAALAPMEKDAEDRLARVIASLPGT